MGSNLNLPMKQLFFPPITTCNNLLLMICCEKCRTHSIFCENVKTSYFRHNIFKTVKLSILYKSK